MRYITIVKLRRARNALPLPLLPNSGKGFSSYHIVGMPHRRSAYGASFLRQRATLTGSSLLLSTTLLHYPVGTAADFIVALHTY